MSTIIISSGVTGSGITVSSGTTLDVQGGTVVNTTVLNGGTEYVYSGSTASGTTVNTGGYEVVSSGGTAIGTVISGGTELVFSGGTASGTTVNSGGYEAVSSGGVAIGTTVNNGGYEAVSSGGTASGTTVSNGGGEIVYSGGVTSGATVNSGGGEIVTSGGTARGTTVNNGGIEAVSSGGVASATTVNSGGSEFVTSGGVASSSTVNSGGGEFVTSGGVASGTTVNIGGNEFVSSGGAASGSVISGGSEYVYSGGAVSGITVNAGGGEYVSSGGTAIGTTVNSGGGDFVSSGGTVSGTTVNTGGAETVLSGGVAVGTVISGGVDAVEGTTVGTVIDSGGVEGVLGTAIDTTVNSGGTEHVFAGASIGGTTSVGGALVLNGSAGSGTIDLVSGGEVVISGTTMPTNVISGFGAGDKIDLASIPLASVTSVSTSGNTLTITAGGTAYTLDVTSVSTEGYKLVADGNGGTFYETCFAAGTRIATPTGEVPVEQLAVGDLVSTLDGARPIVFMGHRTVDVARQPDPETAWLARIREGAFADGVPHRDLLVTQEHCVFVPEGDASGEGRLIPVRMLVNGRSIVLDRGITHYAYHHVELEQHGILLAEGLTMESYLDTGNRMNFVNAQVQALFPDFETPDASRIGAAPKVWADAAAPLTAERDAVEPVWQTLNGRAIAREVPPSSTAPVLTDDPDLHIVADDGRIIRPSGIFHREHLFQIPADAGELRLISRTARPAEVVGPFVDDRRRLGALVGKVRIRWAATSWIAVDHHLETRDLDGWHEREDGAPGRWTSGNASLKLPGASPEPADTWLVIEILAGGPYHAPADTETLTEMVA